MLGDELEHNQALTAHAVGLEWASKQTRKDKCAHTDARLPQDLHQVVRGLGDLHVGRERDVEPGLLGKTEGQRKSQTRLGTQRVAPAVLWAAFQRARAAQLPERAGCCVQKAVARSQPAIRPGSRCGGHARTRARAKRGARPEKHRARTGAAGGGGGAAAGSASFSAITKFASCVGDASFTAVATEALTRRAGAADGGDAPGAEVRRRRGVFGAVERAPGTLRRGASAMEPHFQSRNALHSFLIDARSQNVEWHARGLAEVPRYGFSAPHVRDSSQIY